jgi:antitoxin ParD1/3/4
MNISLTPELEQLVNKKVQSGMYHSASEVIREGLRLLKEQDELKEHRLSRLRNAIDIGSEQIEQGHYTDYDVDNLQPLVEEIKAEGRKRLAQRARAERK